MKDPKRFYTYAYLREDRTPYYIGKGSGRRIYEKGGRPCGKPRDKSRIIFLKQNLIEEEAFKHEKYMIAVLGRKDLGTGILHNRTDGGEGPSGWVPNEEWKRKQSEAKSGENHPLYGVSPSQETREKISQANSGENNPNYGKTHSEETIRKMKEAKMGENHPNYGKPPSQETRKKQSNLMKGQTFWNDGVGNCVRSIECPGERWFPGMGEKRTEERIELGRKNGKKNCENKIGMFALTPEERSRASKKGGSKTANQKWECLETGFVTNAGNLTRYQRARGIDTFKRRRIS